MALESVGESIRNLGISGLRSKQFAEALERYMAMTPLEREQFKVDSGNADEGQEHLKDGYTCSLCKNRGFTWAVDEKSEGFYGHKTIECKCMAVRRSIRKMRESGLGDIIREKTFDKYEAVEPWQKVIKDGAMEYAKAKSGWFFLGGQSGCGKSHLGTAVCREFLLAGSAVAYMVWPDEAPIIKAASAAVSEDYNRREKLVDRLKQAEILYIDDLFKPAKDQTNAKQRPTAADVKLAFEILNYRSNNPQLLTIISSEFSSAELVEIDQATGGRIVEKAMVFNISEDMSRNYRLKKQVTV